MVSLIALSLLLTLLPICSSSSSDPYASLGGRYSFSLSTFDQTGHLAQVEHATTAASLGPPVVAVALSNGSGAVMASLFATPSPLVEDDGTSRFCRITDTIAVSHSGVSADGRAVIAAAQRMAIEHAYTFDEDDVPIDVFLEELSAMFQKYTMKPGSRPFGCSVLVAHLPINTIGNRPCRLYRIDPSGVVQMITPICCIGRGSGDGNKIARALQERKCADASSIEEAEATLLDVMRNELENDATVSSAGNMEKPKLAFLASSLTRKRGLVVRKVLPGDEVKVDKQ